MKAIAPYIILVTLLLGVPTAFAEDAPSEATLIIECADPDTRLHHLDYPELTCDQPLSVPPGTFDFYAILGNVTLAHSISIDTPRQITFDLPLQAIASDPKTDPQPHPKTNPKTNPQPDPKTKPEPDPEPDPELADEPTTPEPQTAPVQDTTSPPQPFELPSEELTWHTLRPSISSGQNDRARSLLPDPSYEGDNGDASTPSATSPSSTSSAPVSTRQQTAPSSNEPPSQPSTDTSSPDQPPSDASPSSTSSSSGSNIPPIELFLGYGQALFEFEDISTLHAGALFHASSPFSLEAGFSYFTGFEDAPTQLDLNLYLQLPLSDRHLFLVGAGLSNLRSLNDSNTDSISGLNPFVLTYQFHSEGTLGFITQFRHSRYTETGFDNLTYQTFWLGMSFGSP